MTGCARTGCPGDPTVRIRGDWWHRDLLVCVRHEDVARAVTGIRQARVPRQRDGQDALFSVAGQT